MKNICNLCHTALRVHRHSVFQTIGLLKKGRVIVLTIAELLTGCILQYFIEPETGFRFRSRIAAERYLNEVCNSSSATSGKPSNQLIKTNFSDENCSLRAYLKYLTEARKIKTALQASKAGNCSTEKHISDSKEVDALLLESPRPPAKVKWVLGGPGGNIWNPLIDEALVAESEKQEWSEKFVFSVRERY